MLTDVAVMDDGEENKSPDNANDNNVANDVTVDTSETTQATGKQQNKASPWVFAEAHVKVSRGKKQSKSSKRAAAAGGGKAKKKGASKTGGPDNEQDTGKVDEQEPPTSPTGSDADATQHGAKPSSGANTKKTSTAPGAGNDAQTAGEENDTAKKADKLLRQTVDA